MCGQRRQVVGIVIHVMAVAGLAGPAVAAPVMGDDAIALFEEEEHLCVPIVRGKRPAMAEHYGLTVAPVFVVDVDVSSVLFPNSYVRHDLFSFLYSVVRETTLNVLHLRWLTLRR